MTAHVWLPLQSGGPLRTGADATADPVDPPDPPDEGGYAETFTARFAPGALADTVATGFPIPFEMVDARLATSGNGGESLDSGQDIRFEIEGTPLAYQRDSYDAATGTLTGWLRLPDGVGAAGFEFDVKVGDDDGEDQSDAASTWDGYFVSMKSDGTNRASGAGNFTLGSGASAHTGDYLDAVDFDGDGGVGTLTGVSWMQRETLGCLIMTYGDPSMEATNRGFMVQTGEGQAASSFMLRNSTTVSGAPNALVSIGWRNGAFAAWRGSASTALGGPQTLCINYATSPTYPQMIIDGAIAAPFSSSSWGSGNLQTFGDSLIIGRGSEEGEGESILGRVGPLHFRSWVYGEDEALLLAQMLWRGEEGEKWNPIQIADGEGEFEDLPDPPELQPEAPGGGGSEPDPTEPAGTYLDTINVTNASELTTALSTAAAGDDIVLAAGTYAGNFTLSASGTAANPIRIRAGTPDSVTMTGKLFLLGARSIVKYLHWRNVNGGNEVVQIAGQFVTFHRNWFTDCAVSNGAQRGILRVMDGAHDVRITYNLWTRITQRGITFLNGSGGALRGYIARCGWNGSTPASSGYSGIACGLGGTETAAAYKIDHQGVVEYCVFENIGGSDGNIIQSKCAGWTFRQLTARNCTLARVEDRRGGYGPGFPINTWEAITLLNSSGIITFGYGTRLNSIYSDNAAGTAGWRAAGPAAGTYEIDETLNQYGRADSQVWANCNCHLILGNGQGPSDWPLPAKDTLIDNHAGTIVNRNQTGTTYGDSGLEPITREVLTLADVGPLAVDSGTEETVADLFANPFNKDSAFHRRVGSGLEVADDSYTTDDEWKAMRDAWLAVVPSNNGQPGGGEIGAINQGPPYGVATVLGTSSDPLRTIRFRNCTDTGAGIGEWQPGGSSTQRRIPDSNSINTSAGVQCAENTAWIVNDSGFEALELFQANNRGGGDYTGSIGRLHDIRGTGHASTLSERVGVSASGCSVRMGLLDSASLLAGNPIRHALKLAIYSGYVGEAYALLGRKIQWPAGNADSWAGDASYNTGPFRYGTMMVIPAAVNLASIGCTTSQGLLIAACLQDYGAYVMDDANGIVIRANGSLGASATAIVADFRKCLRWLRPAKGSVTNATAAVASPSGTYSGSIGTPNGDDVAGGGTPRAINSAYDA